MSFVRYMGGKQLLVPDLLPLIPEHSVYVEVFGGAASLLLNKPPSALEVYNDLDGELVNLFEVIRDDVDGFLKCADFLLFSRELHERWQRDLKTGRIPENRIERAARYWYLLASSFGAHPYKGWGFGRRSNRSLGRTMQNSLQKIRSVHERLKAVQIDHLDFQECLERYDGSSTFLFVDPPYYGTTDYRVGSFTLNDHKTLANILRDAKSNWLLTIGDHHELRDLYLDFSRKTIDSSVAVKKVVGSNRNHLVNLVIYNYDLPKTPLYVPVAAKPAVFELFGEC